MPRNCAVCRASDGWLTIALHSTGKSADGAPLGAITDAPKVRRRQLRQLWQRRSRAGLPSSSSLQRGPCTLLAAEGE